jgi:thioredoxin-related protein
MQFFKYSSLAAIMMFALSCNAQTQESKTETINWVTFEQAVAMAEKEPKNIFIDFYTTWCGWCKVMDKNTFADPVIAALMNKYFYAVKFNAEGKDPVEFRGKTYTFIPQGNRGYHELAAGIMQGQMSYPTFVFLTPTMEIITPISGFVKPEEFEPIVSYMGQNLYKPEKGVEWETYRNNFVGKVGK